MTVPLTSKTRNQVAAPLGRRRQHTLRDLNALVAFAQHCATRAFPGHDLKLHYEFQVDAEVPVDLAGALQRARTVASACESPANIPFLIGKGWYDKHAAGLREVIESLDA